LHFITFIKKKKQFLYQIVTDVTNEKWIYYDNPKRKKSWVNAGIADIDSKTQHPRK